jgi:hypothetical protein
LLEAVKLDAGMGLRSETWKTGWIDEDGDSWSL